MTTTTTTTQTTDTATIRTYVQILLHQGADIGTYAQSLAARLHCTRDEIMAVAATMGPARQVHHADLAAERCRADARMTKGARSSYDHEEE